MPAPLATSLDPAARRWSRTDTERWLNDRNAPLLAWLRRPGTRVAHDYANPAIAAAGSVLRDHDRPLFDRLHTRLLATPAAARDAVHLGDLLP